MAVRDVENINESKINIDKSDWDDESCRMLWAKQQLIFRQYCDYWKPLVQQGKAIMNYMHGEIFDEETRRLYERVQQKICIEPRLLKKRINSVVGQIKQGGRTGQITTEGGMSAEKTYFANMVLKFFQDEIKEKEIVDEMLFTGCAVCLPQVLMFERAVTSYGDALGGLYAWRLPWDSVVVQPEMASACGDDCHELMWITRKSKQELIDENPDRAEIIEKHWKKIFNSSEHDYSSYDKLRGTAGLTIDDASYLNYDVLTGNSNTRVDGRLLEVNRLFPLKINTMVAIHREPQSDVALDYQILPPEWPRQRKEEWAAQHPEYAIVTKNVKVLWHTRWTREGIFLKNKIHWFQEFTNRGDPILPCGIFTPQIVDGKPTGPGIDVKHQILMKAIAETEFLHDIRTGSGDLLAYKKGKIANAEDLPTEMSIGGHGIAVIDDDSPDSNPENFIKFLRRSPNTTYGEYSERVDNQLNQTDMVTEAFQGQSVPYQSGKAKRSDITQAIVGYSFLVDNYNKCLERLHNIECMLIPYCMTEEQVIQVYDDDYTQNVDLPVNQMVTGLNGVDMKNPANDLSSVKWKWRLKPGDDSPTARQAELNELVIFWNTTAPSLIEADPSLMMLASVLTSMSNRTAKEIGRVIAEKAQVQAEQMNQQQMMEVMTELEERRAKADAERIKAARSGFSFSITPEDLAMYPGLFPILVNGGYINTGDENRFRLPAQQQVPAAA